MRLTENMWLDDDNIIVDGKKITPKELENIKTPKSICVSTNLMELITIASIEKEEQTPTLQTILKVILKK